MIAGAAALLTLAQAAPGETGPRADEPFVVEEVACPAGEGSAQPALTRGADGRIYLSWVERRGPRSGTLRLSVHEDGAWSEPTTVASGDDWFINWADFPSVCALADGTLAAAWLERLGEETYAYGVRISVSRLPPPSASSSDRSWSSPRWLHEDRAPVEHGFVSIAPLDDERFGAVWLDGRAMVEPGGAMALYYRTIEGAIDRTIEGPGPLGPEVCLDERVCECCPTALVRRGDGRLRAIFRDRSEEEIRDVHTRESTPAGEWVDAGAPVHRDGWEMPGCPVNGPRLAVLDDRVAAAWYTGAGEGAGRVQVAIDRGSSFDAPRRVDDGAPEGRVDAAFLEDGSLVVTWLEHEEGRSRWRARRLAPDGRPGPSFGIARVASGRASGHLRVVADGRGVLAAWTADGPRVTTARLVPREAREGAR